MCCNSATLLTSLDLNVSAQLQFNQFEATLVTSTPAKGGCYVYHIYQMHALLCRVRAFQRIIKRQSVKSRRKSLYQVIGGECLLLEYNHVCLF